MQEIWKDVPGYEGMYQVSNLGKVKSLLRVVETKTGTKRKLPEKTLKLLSNNGYFSVCLSYECVVKMYRVHQLVAIAFLNHKPNGFELVVDHINHDKLDNRVENLRLVSARDNTSHKKNKGSSKYTGVHWCKNRNKWMAAIRETKGEKKYLGSFTNEYEAHLTYQRALQRIKERLNK